MARSGHKDISRIDSKKTHGWQVRITYQGKYYSKLFSDSLHGGRDKALERAILYRNQLEKKIGRPRTDRVIVTKSPRNKTGVIGVRRTYHYTGSYKEDGSPNTTEVYEVSWQPEKNKIQKKTFSIRKYGEKEAFRLAYEFRKEKERALYGEPILRDSEDIPYPELVDKFDPRTAEQREEARRIAELLEKAIPKPPPKRRRRRKKVEPAEEVEKGASKGKRASAKKKGAKAPAEEVGLLAEKESSPVKGKVGRPKGKVGRPKGKVGRPRKETALSAEETTTVAPKRSASPPAEKAPQSTRAQAPTASKEAVVDEEKKPRRRGRPPKSAKKKEEEAAAKRAKKEEEVLVASGSGGDFFEEELPAEVILDRRKDPTGELTEFGLPKYNEYYEVTYRPKPDVLWKRTVSINEHGEREALRRACILQRQKEEQIKQEE